MGIVVMIDLPPAPVFARDRFRVYWVSADTGVVYSRAEMIRLLGRYEQSMVGKKSLSEPPKRRSSGANKLFELGKNL